MCALLLAGDGPSSLPPHRPVAVTRFPSVVWQQQESSCPAALTPELLAVLRSPGVPPAETPAPTSPAQKHPQDLATASM